LEHAAVDLRTVKCDGSSQTSEEITAVEVSLKAFAGEFSYRLVPMLRIKFFAKPVG
jgi:hypothetical protein